MRFNEFQSPKIPYKDPSTPAKNTIWIPPGGIHVGVTGYWPFVTATGSNWPMSNISNLSNAYSLCTFSESV